MLSEVHPRDAQLVAEFGIKLVLDVLENIHDHDGDGQKSAEEQKQNQTSFKLDFRIKRVPGAWP